MDYGQTTAQDGNQPFFTEGVGNQSVDYTDSPENDLNLSNATSAWGKSNPNRNQNQNEGKNAINGQLIENPNTQPVDLDEYASAPDFGPQPENLGEITDVEPAPTAPVESTAEPIYDKTSLKIEGDSISKETDEFMRKNEKILAKTGDAAAFLDNLSSAAEDTRKNSFGEAKGEQ